MNKVQLIITDLDNTLIKSDNSISQYTQSVFAQCKQVGIMTGIATARYRLGAMRFKSILQPNFEISTDGAMIHEGDSLIYGNHFSLEETNKIIIYLLSIDPKTDITVATRDTVYWNKTNRPKSSILYEALYTDYSSLLDEYAYKIVAEIFDLNIAKHIAKKFNCKLIKYREENKIGFIKKNTGKLEALCALSSIKNISLANVVAFGDDLNDIEMIRTCGTGVAVENALVDVKAVANYICDNNNNDGVAKWIEQNIFI